MSEKLQLMTNASKENYIAYLTKIYILQNSWPTDTETLAAG
jgi:hypothetical protein